MANDAHCKNRRRVSAKTGEPTIAFVFLPPEERLAWMAVAKAVEEDVLRGMYANAKMEGIEE